MNHNRRKHVGRAPELASIPSHRSDIYIYS